MNLQKCVMKTALLFYVANKRMSILFGETLYLNVYSQDSAFEFHPFWNV